MVKFEIRWMKPMSTSHYDFKELLPDDVLKDISMRLSGNEQYEVEWIDKRNIGRYILAYYNGIKHYIALSHYGKAGGRNSEVQSIPTAYVDYYLDEAKKKEFCYYGLEMTGNDTKYFKFAYAMMKTLKVKFLNERKVLNSLIINPFNTPKALINKKNESRDGNMSNKSTYIVDDGANYTIYGKTFGANSKETTFICLAIAMITEKPCMLIQIYDNESDKLSSDDIKAIESTGVFKVEDETYQYPDDYRHKDPNGDEDIRSPKFNFNLLSKFGCKKCALCDCTVDALIQGAHIWPIAAIKKEKNLTTKQKEDFAKDADNGVWLCENHHSLYDANITMFDDLGHVRLIKGMTPEDKSFIKEITKYPAIDKKFLNEKMLFYFHKRFDYYNNL